MNGKHTATQWTVGHPEIGGPHFVMSCGHTVIAILPHIPGGSEYVIEDETERGANAIRIVECVNAHDALLARVAELEAALRPFANYAQKRAAQPINGLADTIHAIHGGTEWEAEITLTDCNKAMELLK